MNRYEIETVVTFKSRVVVLAENLEEARKDANNKIMGELDETSLNLENINLKRISSQGTTLPANLTENHHILLKLNYPVKQVLDFTDEDAEAEIEALPMFY